MKPQQEEVTPIWNCGFYFGLKYIYAITLAVSGKNFQSTLEICKDATVTFIFAVLSCQQAEEM